MTSDRSAQRGWTLLGLAIAFLSLPLVVGVFTALHVSITVAPVVLRELIVFGAAAALAFIIRRKEGLGWASVGLQHPAIGKTAIWVAISIPCVALSLVMAFGLIKLLELPFGSGPDAEAFAALPTWIMLLVIVRAGFVEEFFYRGYAIERLHSLTGHRYLSAVVSLLLFAVFHFRQGWAGIIIALLTGVVLTGVYLRTGNLWITIITHFLGDFIPNIVLPLFVAQ